MKLLLLPNQLFDIRYIREIFLNDTKADIDTIILYEHPQYFTKYKYNKKRLLLHRASMMYYRDYLIKNKYSVKYIEFKDENPLKDKKLLKNLVMFDPVDKLNVNKDITMKETPNFLLTKEQYQKYRDTKSKSFFFNGFYMWSKKEIDIIPDIKSQDKYNRLRADDSIKFPDLPQNTTSNENKYIEEAIKYVEKHFPDNYGTTNDFQYPISHKTAHSWLKKFISIKFHNFGPYQDAIIKNENYMFHSVLSSSINIGLINPSEIIEIIKPIYNKILNNKTKIPLNSFEGYIRQLFWREYQRFCYIYYDFTKVNFFGNTKKLDKNWYDGTLGIEPVDDTIKSAFETGYLHHILRLMVVGNWMNLSGISPNEGFKWFMEFSCDSYEWVMMQNVMDMVFCVSGGVTMRKPYISSSNYILKMSNYKKDKKSKKSEDDLNSNWTDKWDKQYRYFLDKHKEKLLSKFAYTFAMRYGKNSSK